MGSFNIQELISSHGAKSLAVALIIIAGIAVYLTLSRFFSELNKRQAISEPLSQIFRKITKIVVFAIIILFTLQQFGVKVSEIVTSLLTILAMIAIGFIAVWSVFSNFLSSFLIIIFTPFRIGDTIEIAEVVGGTPGLRGKVVDFSIMYTSLLESGETPEEEKALIRIPNNIFFQKAIKRWKGEERKSVEKHLLDKSLTNC